MYGTGWLRAKENRETSLCLKDIWSKQQSSSTDADLAGVVRDIERSQERERDGLPNAYSYPR